MITINKTNIKTILDESSIDYDNQIDILIPQLLNAICSELKNEFVAVGYNGKVYDACDLVFTSTTITYDTDIVNINFQAGDFIRIYGTDYNNGLYQINTVESGVITIETSKSMRTESVSGYIALVNFPDEFLNLISDYIKSNIVNDSNVKAEKIDDTQITYNDSKQSIKGFIASNLNTLNSYRCIFYEGLFEGSEY